MRGFSGRRRGWHPLPRTDAGLTRAARTPFAAGAAARHHPRRDTRWTRDVSAGSACGSSFGGSRSMRSSGKRARGGGSRSGGGWESDIEIDTLQVGLKPSHGSVVGRCLLHVTVELQPGCWPVRGCLREISRVDCGDRGTARSYASDRHQNGPVGRNVGLGQTFCLLGVHGRCPTLHHCPEQARTARAHARIQRACSGYPGFLESSQCPSTSLRVDGRDSGPRGSL